MTNSQHIYTWPDTDIRIPSVTTIIHDILNEPEMNSWSVVKGVMLARQNRDYDFDQILDWIDAERDAAAEIGTGVHDVVKAFHDETEWPEVYNNPTVAQKSDAYISWAQSSYIGKPQHVEEIGYANCSTLGGLYYGGRPDIGLVTLKAGTRMGTAHLVVDTTALVDIKTGAQHDYWALQLTGYGEIVNQTWGIVPEIFVTVRIDKEGVHPRAWNYNYGAWEALVKLWYWRYNDPQKELLKRIVEEESK